MNENTKTLLIGYVISFFIVVGILFITNFAYGQFDPLAPEQGGTGTVIVPNAGEVLVGQSNGTYAPQATSTLGISGGGITSTAQLTSTSTIFGDTLTLNTSSTDQVLKWSKSGGNLIFNDPEGKQILIIRGASTTIGRSLNINGHALFGQGTSLSQAANTTQNIVRISEDSSDYGVDSSSNPIGGWRTALLIDPYQNQDLGRTAVGTALIAGQYGVKFQDGFNSSDGDNATAREHWDVINDGAVADSSSTITGVNQIAQSFFVASTTSGWENNEATAGVAMLCYRIGDPGTLTVAIKSVDASHKPVGTLVSDTLSVSSITTSTAGEFINIPFSFPTFGGGRTEGKEYSIVMSVSGAGTLQCLSDTTSGLYTVGYGFTSADSGATWTGIGAGGIGDFLFDHYAWRGAPWTFQGHVVTMDGSLSNFPLASPTSTRMFNIVTNMSLPSHSPRPGVLIGYDVQTMSIGNGTSTPQLSYAFKASTVGNGVTNWAFNGQGDIQANTTSKFILGSSATAKGGNYLQAGATTASSTVVMGLNNLLVLRFTSSSLDTATGTNALFDLGTTSRIFRTGYFGTSLITGSSTSNNTTITSSSIAINGSATSTLRGDGATSTIGTPLRVQGGTSTIYAMVGGTLDSNTTSYGNAAAAETSIASTTITTSTLLRNGDAIRFMGSGSWAIGLTNRVKVNFGGENIFDTGSQNVASLATWIVNGQCTRSGTNTQVCSTYFNSSFGTLSAYANVTSTSATSTNSNLLDLRGNGTSANDTTKKDWRVWYDPSN